MSYTIEQADEQIRVSHNANEPGFATAAATRAVALATLELAEQQRITNVISLMQMQAEIDEKTEMLAGEAMHALIEYERTPATQFNDPDDVAVIRPDIKKALGLQ